MDLRGSTKLRAEVGQGLDRWENPVLDEVEDR